MGLRCVQLEGDAKLVVYAIKKNTIDYSWNGQLIEDIKGVMMSHQNWSIQYVARTGNKAADAATKLGLSLISEQVWIEVASFVIFDNHVFFDS